MAAELKVPVTCKIRCFKNEEETLKMAKDIENAGCSLLTVHGRTRFHNKQTVGNANWDIIKKIKQNANIPVFANGGIAGFDDVHECMEFTGVDGVMSSEYLLEYPALFEGKEFHHVEDLAIEYLELTKQYSGAPLSYIKAHLHKMLHTGLKENTDLRARVVNIISADEGIQICNELKEYRKDVVA